MSWKHVDITAFGGPENIQLIEEPDLPEPGPGQVRVRVLTAGTGFTDTIIRRGQYVGIKDVPPFTLGYDWFGVVDKLGAGVSNHRPGDHVADLSVIGGYTQYLCVDADRAVPCPPGLDPAQAVCMILTYTTAYQMLTREAKLKAGDTILVHAAGGAVGTALLELGSLMGLRVLGTASTAKHELVRSLGGIPIDYRTEDFVARTLEICPGGVAAVFDTLGGKSWGRSYRCLARGGRLVGFGAMQISTGQETIPQLIWGFAKLLFLWKLIPDGKSTRFYNIQPRRAAHPQDFNQDLATLMGLLAAGKLHPVVADTVALDRAAEVHGRIDRAEHGGKIVLRCNDY